MSAATELALCVAEGTDRNCRRDPKAYQASVDQAIALSDGKLQSAPNAAEKACWQVYANRGPI